MKTIADLVAQRGDDAVAIGAPRHGEQVYTYDRLQRTVWSMARVLADRGVEPGDGVAIAPINRPETVIAFLGSAVLGSVVWFRKPTRIDAAAVVGPTEAVTAYELPGGAARIGYGSRPDTEAIVEYESAVWKAEESAPEAGVLPNTKVLTDGETQFSHRNLLTAASEVVEKRGLGEETVVAIRAPLTDPRTIAGGLIAPLVAGGTIRLPSDDVESGDIAVTDDDAPESRILLLLDVPLD